MFRWAIKLQPVGVQPGLKPTELRGEVAINPHEDFFRTVIEQRHELADKKSDLGQLLRVLIWLRLLPSAEWGRRWL